MLILLTSSVMLIVRAELTGFGLTPSIASNFFSTPPTRSSEIVNDKFADAEKGSVAISIIRFEGSSGATTPENVLGRRIE